MELPPELSGASSLPAVLLPYQQELIRATARSALVVCEKSRRIGMTWGVGADAVLTSGAARAAGGMDTLYIGFNRDLAVEFIDVCAMWARAFMQAEGEIEEFLFDDAGKDIQAFKLRFASGFEIVALTSKPRSLRGRQGFVIFDEAAFHEQLDEMLKAAMALLMWGGKVLVISTHDGADNPFNELVQEIREGRRKGEVLRVTIDDAVAAGLYERIALVRRLPATPEARAGWLSDIFAFYGEAADEELRCIPRAGSGVYLTRAAIDRCMTGDGVVVQLALPDDFQTRPMARRVALVAEFIAEKVAPVLARLDPDAPTGLGVDFGRTTDLSVFAVGQELASLMLHVPLIIELKGVPLAQQQQILEAVIAAIRRFRAAKFDATGNGLGLAEWAQERWGMDRIEAVKISRAWYLEHVPPLKARIEDITLSIPRNRQVRDDLRAIRLVDGVPVIPADRKAGRHGDAAVALIMLDAAMRAEVTEIGFRAAGRRDSLGGFDLELAPPPRRGGMFRRAIDSIAGAWE
jgi:phage FluMu gp28-like protein